MIQLLQLITKEVISLKLKHGQELDSRNQPVRHLLILLEHMLRHGLKTNKVL